MNFYFRKLLDIVGFWLFLSFICSISKIEKINNFWKFKVIKIHDLAGNNRKILNIVDKELFKENNEYSVYEVFKLLTIYKKKCFSIESKKVESFLKKHLSTHAFKADEWNWQTLKKYSSFAKIHNDHPFYQMAITNVCDIDSLPQMNKSKFFGSGWGKNTLNSYRRLELDNGEIVFEKVYKKDSYDLMKLKFYFEQAYPTIKHYYTVPKVELVEGKIGAVAYFDWLDEFEPIEKKNILKAYSEFREVAIKVQPDLTNFGNVAWEFSNQFFEGRRMEKARDWISTQNLDVENMNLLEKLKIHFISLPLEDRIFTHGDFVPSNVGKNGLIIDFDRCGMYPTGYELARLSCLYNFDSIDDLESMIGTEIDKLSKINQIGFYFFAFLFYQRKNKDETTSIFLMEVLNMLNKKVKDIKLKQN